MTRRTFPHGIHPPDRKDLSAGTPSAVLAPPATAVVPLLQHTGKPSTPRVKKGDRVLRGQTVGDADGLISAPVHAPVSGTVRAIEPHVAPGGGPLQAVIIENDGRDELAEEAHPPSRHWGDLSPDEVRAAVRSAGIVGMGGAAFPTAVKLTPPRDFPVDTVIINGAECEPYLTTDYRLMLEKSQEILDGAEVMRRTVGARQVVLAVEDNKPAVLERLAGLLAGRPGYRLEALRTKYPQGGEKMLIRAVLKRDVPAGGLPFHVGVLVQNVATAVAVRDALVDGLPLVQRMLTVSGDAVRQPRNLWVRIGTPFAEVIAACGGAGDNLERLLMGGPMMGLSQWTPEVPVVKATSGILLLAGDGAAPREYSCIRCNRCVGHCPMNLVPTRIVHLVRAGELDEGRAWGLTDCMECGSCAALCPAAIPLVAWLRLGKFELQRRARASGGKA